jgi:hypothetical protein
MSNYFPVLTRYFGISTVYHGLFASGGQIIGLNPSAKVWPGELRARIGRI